MNLKISLSFFILLFLTLEANAQSPKELNIGVVQEWNEFNPVTMNLASTQSFRHFVLRSFVVRTDDGKLLPDLAQEIPTRQNGQVQFVTIQNQKKVQATWKIRKNAKWGDGTLITCKDWWLGWQVGLSPQVEVTERNVHSKIEKIEWTEKENQTCKATYANSDWTYDRDLPPPLPSHLESAVFEKWKDQAQAYSQNSIYLKNPTHPGLYNGPYAVSQYQLGSSFVLSPNPYFFGTKPQIQKIIVKHIADTGTLRSHLISGNIQMISAVGFPPDLALLLDKEFSKTSPHKVLFQDSPIFQGIFLNLENEILKDLRVRQALSMAVHKEEISKAFFQNQILPAETFLAPKNPAFKKEASQYSLAKAQKLLDEAGWKADGKGIRSKDGKPLALEFRTSSGIKILETIQTYICSSYQRLGVQCLQKNQPPRVFLGESVPHGDFALAMFGQPVLPDSSLRGIFSSKEIPTKDNSFAGGNSTRFRSSLVDEKLNQFDQEWNPQKRIRLVQEIHEVIKKEIPFIPLYHRREAIVLPKALKGYTADISGTEFIFPEKWEL